MTHGSATVPDRCTRCIGTTTARVSSRARRFRNEANPAAAGRPTRRLHRAAYSDDSQTSETAASTRGCPVNPRVIERAWAGSFAPAFGRRWPGGGWVSSFRRLVLVWLGRLVEGDGVAECFELALEASGAVLDGVALALPARARDPDMGLGRGRCGSTRRVGRGGSRRSLSAPRGGRGVARVRGEVGAFRADRGAGAFGELRGQPRGPGRVRPTCRRPADSWWPGHAPAQEAKCPTVGNTLMSRPHSAIKTSAARAWTPGTVESNSMIWACGARHELDPLGQVLQRGVERVDVREQLRDHDPVMLDL